MEFLVGLVLSRSFFASWLAESQHQRVNKPSSTGGIISLDGRNREGAFSY